MYALEAKTPSAQRGLRTEQSPLRGFVKWTDKYQIGSNGSINNYHFTDELVLIEGEIVQYGTTTGGFQQNFGVFTNFNNVFLKSYDLLLPYFMPGFEQICRVVNYREKIQLSTTVLQYLQPDLSFSLTLALSLASWTSPTSTS